MKKSYTILSFLAVAALVASCSKEAELPQREDTLGLDSSEDITLVFAVPNDSALDTKTALGTKDGSSYPVKWSNGDPNRISLNGSTPTASTKDSDTQITASFKPTSGLSVYNFLYRGVDGRDNQVSIPASQTYYANDFDDAAMPMYAAFATRPSGTVTFNHLCALLKFSITGSFASGKGIDSITLTAVDGGKSLSGTFTIGKNGSGLLNGALTPASGGGTINFRFGSHIRLTDTPFVFYVAIPAGTYTGGIQCEIVDNENGHMVFKVLNDNNTITAGKVRELGTFEYVQSKLTNTMMIYDDATFLSFVNEVNVNNKKTLNALITKKSDLYLADATISAFNSIEDYEGVFDGNGLTISGLTKPLFSNLKGVVKNLTLNSSISITDASDLNLGIFARRVVPGTAVDDIGGLKNCTAKGTITFTPSTALSGNPCIGGLVGNNLGGAFIGCTNEATVRLADNAGVTHTGDRQPSIGGVIGRTQKGGALSTNGSISDCTNSGTVSCEEQFEGNIMIGGVVGYGVEVAENISGCTNSGLVKAASTCSTTKVLHIGGVAGMYKGEMESCSNLTLGEVTTESGSAAGTQLNQGGVVGRLNNGSGSYSGLSNAGKVNVAATGGSSARLIGGVVGRCNEGSTITDFTNSGDINYTSEDEKSTYIGGVVASNTVSGVTLENCRSTGGTLNYSGTTERGPLYIGGVVGYSTKPVSSCTNAMTIDITSDFTATSSNQYFSTGGVVGKVSGNALISNCLNTGNINYGLILYGSYGYTFVGGIVGHTNGSIENSSNGGTITITGKNNANNPFYGGVVGSTDSANEHSITGKYPSASATNYGSVVVNTTVQSGKWIYVGGVAGRLHTNGSMTATNAGTITITRLSCTSLFLGGLTGLANGPIESGSLNMASGDISVTGLTSGQGSYFGGLAGKSVSTIIGNNAGDIVISSGSSVGRDYATGGIVGQADGALSSCTNSGLISNAAPMTGGASYWLQIGGVAGWSNTGATITGCHNTGNVTNTGNSGGYITIGGISSENKALISSCDNTGNVTNSGNSGNERPIAIGGVVGYAHAAGLTSCSNGTSSAAGGTISNSGSSAAVYKATDKVPGIAIGGVAGMNDGYTITTCYNKGEVSNAGASPSSYIVVGGLVGLSKGGSSYVAPCYNIGAVSNTGLVGAKDLETPDNDKWVDVGGLIGLAFEANTLSGTSSVYNYNSGTVTENSESIKPYVGGVCGESDYAASDFTYCSNLSGGNLTIKNNTRRNITIGGVVGADWQSSTMTNTSNSGNIYVQDITGSNCINVGGVLGLTGTATLISGADASHRTTNSGNIQFKTCTYSGAIRVGGILGAWDHEKAATIQYCTNNGTISTYTTTTSSADLNATTGTYSGIGGVVGTTANYAAANNKTISDCVNTGNITIYSAGAFYLGGVAGCARGSISNCSNTGTITYGKGSTTKRGKCMIGGVVGYGWSLGASGLYFNGTIDAHEADYSKETGVAGLVGEQNSDSTFSSCKIGGTIWGGPNDGTTGAGLFICPNQNTKRSSTYTSCIIKTGTVIKYDSNTQTTINSTSDLTATNLHGRMGSSSSSTTGISVGSID